MSYNTASASLWYPSSHDSAFSPTISQGTALSLLFWILFLLLLLSGIGT